MSGRGRVHDSAVLRLHRRIQGGNAANAFWGATFSNEDQLETAVEAWSQPGPALLQVHVNPMQPVMQVEPANGMALYSARVILHDRERDVWEMKGEFLD
jgi:pyruvate dehydrogenase (quinone)